MSTISYWIDFYKKLNSSTNYSLPAQKEIVGENEDQDKDEDSENESKRSSLEPQTSNADTPSNISSLPSLTTSSNNSLDSTSDNHPRVPTISRTESKLLKRTRGQAIYMPSGTNGTTEKEDSLSVFVKEMKNYVIVYIGIVIGGFLMLPVSFVIGFFCGIILILFLFYAAIYFLIAKPKADTRNTDAVDLLSINLGYSSKSTSTNSTSQTPITSNSDTPSENSSSQAKMGIMNEEDWFNILLQKIFREHASSQKFRQRYIGIFSFCFSSQR